MAVLHEILLAFLMSMLLMTKQMVSSELIEANMHCISDEQSCGSQTLQSNDTISFNLLSSCGNCMMNASSTTPGLGIKVTVMIPTTWSVYDYFYILGNETTNIIAFTGETDQCEINLKENNIKFIFHATGNIKIQASKFVNSLCRNHSEHGDCNPEHNCRHLQNFDKAHAVTYDIVKSYFDLGGYMHPELYRLYGEYEHRAYMPMCPTHCVCSLSFQKLTAHCPGDETIQTLILYTKITLRFRIALDITSRRITSISPGAFKGLHVDRLCLGHNLLTKIEIGTFQGMVGGLNSIEMENNGITHLSSNVFHGLGRLVYLQLRDNKLLTLPPDLFQYQVLSLRWLDLTNNNVMVLTAQTLKKLLSLSSLIMKNTNLIVLEPHVFESQLSSLYFLVLDQNQISTLQPDAFIGGDSLVRLHLKQNLLTSLDTGVFDNLPSLQELILSRNNIIQLKTGTFTPLQNLLSLDLSHNKIKHLESEAFSGLHKLIGLKLHGNAITRLASDAFVSKHLSDKNNTVTFPNLQFVFLNQNQIESIDHDVLHNMPSVDFVNIRDNPLSRVDHSSFDELKNGTVVFVDNPATCCFITNDQCKAANPKAPYLTCQRLLPNITLRAFMWIFGVAALLGNTSVLIWRCLRHGRENIVQVMLIKNLAASDLLMSVYMLIITSADVYYQQFFPSEADAWRSSFVCKLAGTLSILSSEASVFIITLISIDRYLAIRYPRGKQRLTRKSAVITLFLLWVLAMLLSVIPASLSGIESDFYDASEVCIGLPFVRSFLYHNTTALGFVDYGFTGLDYVSSVKDLTYDSVYIFPESSSSPSQYYSIILFLGLNLACFVIVAVCYVKIFIIYKRVSTQAGKSHREEDIALAIKMGALVITDFMCWMPIIVIGTLVQANLTTISPVVYVYIVVFVLPINSAINPYLYTVGTIISDKKKRPRKKKMPKPRRQLNDSQVGIVNDGLDESSM